MKTATQTSESLALCRLALLQLEKRLDEAIALAEEIAEHVDDLSEAEFDKHCSDRLGRVGEQLEQVFEVLESFTSFE